MAKAAQVVIVNGSPCAGKDTFCSFCDHYGFTETYSSVDHIKSVAKMLGWNGVKDAHGRKLLSDLKAISAAYNDLPMKLMRNFVDGQKTRNDVIFLMIREPEEIERAKHEFDALAIFIDRPGNKTTVSNRSDRDVAEATYDYVIQNDGTLEDLRKKADVFMYAVKTH